MLMLPMIEMCLLAEHEHFVGSWQCDGEFGGAARDSFADRTGASVQPVGALLFFRASLFGRHHGGVYFRLWIMVHPFVEMRGATEREHMSGAGLCDDVSGLGSVTAAKGALRALGVLGDDAVGLAFEFALFLCCHRARLPFLTVGEEQIRNSGGR